MAHIYDWFRERGYWLAKHAPAERRQACTHLMMDGGMACVPDEAHAAFLNAYAASLVRHPARPPSIVELRTPVFRFFTDLDTRFTAAAQDAEVCALLLAIGKAVDAVAGASDMVVCSSTNAAAADGGKRGFHLIWPDVLVRQSTAFKLRDAILRELRPPGEYGLAPECTWDTVLDPSVYRANGLRMPWSAKGRHDARVYKPTHLYRDGALAEEAPAASVSALRASVHRLSIRAPGADPTLVASADDDADAAAAEIARAKSTSPDSLEAYGDVLPSLAAALPVQFLGQRFTAVMHHEPATPGAPPNSYLLRSSSRFCFNLGRAHRTNNVYFVLSRRGVHQRCYCRCETAEGRKYGMCKDFASSVWPVSAEVTKRFFGDAGGGEGAAGRGGEARGGSAVAPMPSRVGKTYWSLGAIMSRQAKAPAGRPAKKAKQ